MRASLVCCSLLLAVVPAAHAQGPVFGAPQVLGGDGGAVEVEVGPLGDALVVWSGEAGTYAAHRPTALTPFAAPVRVAPPTGIVDMVRAPDGRHVLLSGSSVRVGDAAGSFGEPDPWPVPERAPVAPGNESVVENSRAVHPAQVAATAGGTVAVGLLDVDHRADQRRAVVSVRRGDGSWEEPQVLGGGATSGTFLATAGDTLVAMWSARDPGAPEEAPARIWVAERGPLDPAFGTPRALSPAGAVADNGFTAPSVHANAQGQALVRWNGSAGPTPFPDTPYVAERDATGTWGAPRPVGAGAGRSVAALGSAGHAAVAWNSGLGIGAALRDGGRWSGGLVETDSGASDQPAVAVDAIGTTVVFRRDERQGSEGVVAAVRPAGGRFSGDVRVTPRGTLAVSLPEIGLDELGNGVVAYTAAGSRTVTAFPYSARPPRVSDFEVTPEGFGLVADEFGRATIELRRAGRTRARLRTALAPASNYVPYTRRARRALRRDGRFKAVVRSSDAVRRSAKKTFRFRR